MELLHDMLDQIERQRLTKMVNEIPDHDLIDSRSVARVVSNEAASVLINYTFMNTFIRVKQKNAQKNNNNEKNITRTCRYCKINSNWGILVLNALRGCKAPWFICWFRRYKIIVCLLT